MRNTRAQDDLNVGVSKTPGGRYAANIHVADKPVRLGTYDTIEQARAARKGGEMLHWGKGLPDLSFMESF